MPNPPPARARHLALAALLAAVACREPAPPPPPDILLVVLDTVRADRLSAYGYERPTGRQLEAIASAGVLFEDTTAPSSWTWTSHASLFTGLQPWEHGAHATDDPAYAVQGPGQRSPMRLRPLRGAVPTLAEQLGAAGYRTVSISGNHLLEPSLGLTRGFDQAVCHQRDSAVVEAAQQAMAEQDGRPLLLFVNLMSAHSPNMLSEQVPWSAQHAKALAPDSAAPWSTPYLIDKEGLPGIGMAYADPATGTLGERAFASGELTIPDEGLAMIGDLYDGDLVRLDQALKALVGSWNASGRGQGVVAVVSDHGEYLGEHRQLGHGRSLYREVWQVPMVIAAPGRLPAGLRVERPVALVQLHPTLLRLAGLDSDDPGLLPIIDGGAGPRRILASLWGQGVEPLPSGVGGAWRLIREGNELGLLAEGHPMALYDLEADPDMLHDLAATRPERAVELEAALAPSLRESAPPDPPIRVGADTLQQLEALGYVSPTR